MLPPNRYQTIGVASVALKKLMKRPKKNAKAGVAGVGLTMEEGLIYGAEWSDVGKGMLKVEKQYALVARLLLKYLARVDVSAAEEGWSGLRLCCAALCDSGA